MVKDIYFNPKYGKLYEKVEKGKLVCWEYECDEGKIYHQFILREIPDMADNKTWYDIVSPYGYGGPVVEFCKEGKESYLLEKFEQEFEKYCEENNIVSEFVRFHPIAENGVTFQSVYNAGV